MPLGIQANCTLAAILLFQLAPESADSGTTVSPTHQQGAESAAAVSPGTSPTLSHREKAGLRGPVEECAVETTAPSGPGSSAWPNPDSLLSPEVRERLSAEPGALEKAGGELAQFLEDWRLLARSSYVCDDQGRVIEKHSRFGPSEEEITRITYNDHGDEAEQIETTSNPRSSPAQFDARLGYQYDNLGNWAERTVSSPLSANQSSKTWSIERRNHYVLLIVSTGSTVAR